MPIYEYVCEDCGKRFEALILGREAAKCPKCESERLAKQFSAFAVHGGGKGEMDWGGDCEGGACDMPMPGACGSCGDPRGPGACGLD